MEGKIVNVVGRRTLDNIKVTGKGKSLSPVIYRQKDKNPNSDGDFEEDYSGRPFMGARKFIPPIWDSSKNKWFFSGTPELLGQLISKMNLRYEKGHPKQGQVIEPGMDPESRLYDKFDPVFLHKEFFTGYYLSDGRTSFNLDDPKQQFLFLCYKGNKEVWDRTDPDGKKPNKHRLAGSTIELTTVGTQNINKKDNVDVQVTATIYLNNMQNDIEKMKMICDIMRVPGYSRKTTDPNAVFLLLFDTCVTNSQYNSKFGTTWQKEFVRLCELDPEELDFRHKIKLALMQGVLRQKSGYYSFKGERLEIKTESELIEFFKNHDNQEKYLELESSLNL